MKKITTLLLLLAAICFHSKVSAQDDPVAHMNEILEPLNEFKTETWQYLKAVTRGKGARKVEAKRQKLIQQIGFVKNTVKSKKAYKGDESLKEATVDYLDMTYTVLKEDFGKILDMEDIAEQSYDLMEAYLLAKEKANEKLDEASDKVQAAQKAFAEKHDINLLEGEDDKTSAKIKKAGEALHYYNEVYLIFFKVYKQELYVIEAQQRNDVAAMEQNLETLKMDIEQGYEKLKNLESYDGDAKLIAAAEKVLKFYEDEAENEFPIMVDFFLKKDAFETTKTSFEGKSKKQRTNADIENFNTAVNDYNEAIESMNKANESANEGRQEALKNWNKSVGYFFDTHSK